MIETGMDGDAGGSDMIGGSVAEAMAEAMANYGEKASDTLGAGSTIGDLVNLPGAPDVDTAVLQGVPMEAPKGP